MGEPQTVIAGAGNGRPPLEDGPKTPQVPQREKITKRPPEDEAPPRQRVLRANRKWIVVLVVSMCLSHLFDAIVLADCIGFGASEPIWRQVTFPLEFEVENDIIERDFYTEILKRELETVTGVDRANYELEVTVTTPSIIGFPVEF